MNCISQVKQLCKVDIKPANPNVMIDKDEFEKREAKKVQDGHTWVRMFIITSNDGAARLIGLRGETVTKLREEFADVNLRIGNKVRGIDEQVTKVQGPIEKVTELLIRIAKITVEPRYNDEPLLTLLVHNAGGLIGVGGQRVRKLREESGATIKIAKAPLAKSSQTPVTVTGNLEALEKVTRMILEFISTCEPVNIVYTPEMAVDRRGIDRRWGVRRRDWTRGWHGCHYKDAKSFSGGSRWADRRVGDNGRRDVLHIRGRYGDGDLGYLEHRWGNPDVNGWEDIYSGNYGGGYVPGWDSGALRGGKMRDDYDPFESSPSTRGFWTPSNGGWTVPGPWSGGWKSFYSRNDRGWVTPGGPKQDWDLGTLSISWRWQWLRRNSRQITE